MFLRLLLGETRAYHKAVKLRFLRRIFGACFPGRAGEASGSDSYAWVKAAEILYLRKSGQDATAARVIRELQVSSRRISEFSDTSCGAWLRRKENPMKCINFDDHFADFTSAWMKEHGKEYRNFDAMEADMPRVYMTFLNTPAKWWTASPPARISPSSRTPRTWWTGSRPTAIRACRCLSADGADSDGGQALREAGWLRSSRTKAPARTPR
jgi:hypothetical protein